MDNLTQFFTNEGFTPTPEYFLESEFLLGYKLEQSSFRLIYRQEQERLILCEFASTESDGTAIKSVITLLKKAVKAVPQIRHVDALILPAERDEKLNKQRERLRALMMAEGGKPIILNGEKWIRCSC